jgi:hypothetical protein
MRLTVIAAACTACCLLTGCEERLSRENTNMQIDQGLVNVLNNIGLENAIIAQHTLYPYHFVYDGEKLNGLGERDFAVLVRHFREHAGVLNIRHGGVSAELYKARVVWIAEMLRKAGIASDRVRVSDGMPGGAGVSSERMLMILSKEADGSIESAMSDDGRITQ